MVSAVPRSLHRSRLGLLLIKNAPPFVDCFDVEPPITADTESGNLAAFDQAVRRSLVNAEIIAQLRKREYLSIQLLMFIHCSCSRASFYNPVSIPLVLATKVAGKYGVDVAAVECREVIAGLIRILAIVLVHWEGIASSLMRLEPRIVLEL